MSIDLDQIKNKLEKLQNQSSGGGNGKNLFWKPTEGEQTIRIVPYIENPSNPFIEMYFHYNFGGERLVSPISFGDPDPIAEFAQKLRKSGDEDSYEQSKAFQPKMRTHVPIIVRGEEDQGIRYWGFGKQVYEQLLGYIADPEWGDITHPKEGRDIKVEYEKPDKGYPKTTIRPRPSQTKALEDLQKLKEMSEELPSLKKLNEALSYDELESKLNAYLNGDSTKSDDSTPSEKPKQTAASEKEDAPWEGKKTENDVEAEFDNLFED